MLIQPFVTHSTVETFDVGILLWFARLDILQLYLLYMLTKADGICLSISDGVVDPGGHVVHG